MYAIAIEIRELGLARHPSQCHLTLHSLRHHYPESLLDNLFDIDTLLIAFQLPGFKLEEVEHAVDEVQQKHPFDVNVFGVCSISAIDWTKHLSFDNVRKMKDHD